MPRDLSPDEIAARYGNGAFYNEAPAADNWTRLGASVDRFQAGLVGIGEAAGLDWGDWRRQNELEQEQAMQRYYRSNPTEPQSFRDVNGIGSGLRYVRGLAIDSAPELAISAATGGAGALAGMGTAGRLGLAAAANYPSAVGDILQNQREENGTTNLGVAGMLGVPYAAADLVGLEGALARGRFLRTGMKSLDEMQGMKGVAARTGANAALNFTAEGAGETFQEMVNQTGRIAVNPTQTLFNQDANERYLESFVGGGLLGAGVSTAMGGWRRSPEFMPRTVDEGQFDMTRRSEAPAPMLPQGYNLTTQMSPIQDRINENLGINRKPAGGYAKQFNAAFNEPSGVRVNDENGIERELTVGEVLQRQAEMANPTPAAPATPTATSKVFDETDRVLMDRGVKPSKLRRDLVTEMQAANLDPEGDSLVGFWTAMAQGHTGKAKKLLADAIVESKKEQANVSTPSGVVAGPGVGNVAGSPDVQRGVVNRGPVPTGPVAGSGNAVGAGTAAPQTLAVPATQQQPTTTVSRTPSQSFTPRTDTNEVQYAEDEDALEIAKMTGQNVSAIQDEMTGRRADGEETAPATPDVDRIVQARFAGSKNADRDGKILRAYLTALRAAPNGSKGAIQTAIGKQFGVGRESVRAIGNPQELARVGEELGFDRDQVFEILGINDNAKGESSEPSKNAYKLQQLKKAYAEATDPKRKERLARLMSRRSELLAKAKDKAEKERSDAVSSGLRAAGVEFDAEEGSGMGGLDEDRRWVEESNKGSKDAVDFIALADQIDALREAAAEYEQQGMDEVAAQVQQQIAEAQAKLDALVESINKKGPRKVAAAAKQEAAAEEDEDASTLEDNEPAPAGYQTEAQRAGKAWDEVANEYPDAPRWEDLSQEQRDTFIDYGEENWTADDVQAELTKLAKGAKFGKSAVAKNPYDATELLMEISRFVRSDIPGRKLLVVDSISDLIGSKDKTLVALGVTMELEGAYGVASDGRAILIANRIEKGEGRGKFMHEVGAHLGLEKLLPKALYDRLTQQLVDWAKKEDGSIESEIALAAAERVQAAGTEQEDRRSELLAYFLEEADKRGINPIADDKASGPLRNWFRTLWAAFKVAIRKLGFKPEALNAQDVVNLAFGAARLEIAGTFHGTAAQFRRFNHKYMGSGEGAQAYGWGSYLAQRFGIAKGYWMADVDRKTQTALNDVAYSYGGLNNYQQSQVYYSDGGTEIKLGQTSAGPFRVRESGLYIPTVENTGSKTPGARSYKAADQIFKKDGSPLFSDQQIAQMLDYVKQASATPEGAVMRVDVGVSDDEVLDWDNLLRKQVPVFEKLEEKLPIEIKEALEEETNLSLEQMTGQDLYEGLKSLEMKDGLISEQFDVEDYNNRLANSKAKRIVSAYLDEKIGIPALKFLDAESRSEPLRAVVVNGKQYTRQDLIDMKRETTGIGPHVATLRHMLRNGVEETVKELERKVAEHTARTEAIYKDSAARYNVPYDAAEGRARAEQDAQFTYEGQQLEWFKANKVEVVNLADNRTRNLVVFNDKNIFRVGSRVDNQRSKMKFGKNAEAPTGGVIAANVAKLPKQVQKPARVTATELNRRIRKGLDALVFTSDLVKRATDAGIKSADTFRNLVVRQATRTRELERDVERIADMYALVPEADRTGDRSVNRFLFESTRQGKWGFQNKNMKADPEMAEWYESLDQKSQEFVRAVFAHGDQMLQVKKDTVMKFTASEYDAHIAQLEKAINGGSLQGEELDTAKKELAQTKRDKRNDLAKFERLFKIHEGKPYAPIKRFGPYAVVAKSQEYMDAVSNKDMKKVRELEQSEDHYHVSFTETAAEAAGLADELDAEGAYAKVQHFERSVGEDGLFGDQTMMTALTNLRARVNSSDRPGTKQLQQIVTDMWLQNLAESSARKSEMRRRGVAGEVDMLRSFTSQGRADANFLAATQYGSQIQDAMQSMHKETREARDRTRASEVMNEMDKRYQQTFERTANPWLDKLRRMSSVYFLATSPAYYIQNLTQPWMMSVPAMTGAHDYTKIHAELGKAYAEMKAVVKSGGLLNQMFDYKSVPDDVRLAIQELVNRGKIDIGMDTELGQFRVEGHGYFKDKINKVDKGLRLAIQKVESINRLSTAMTAYRLERSAGRSHEQALSYADRILTETHGDYTAFNAPRAFNTQLGKVALQFRKFQLLQIGYYAKLINDIFTSPKDRAAALKMLGFSLAHTAALAGVRGLPGFATLAWVASKLLGSDDEPYDLEQAMRNYIGDTATANALMRGLPTLVGADISGKVGAGNMLSVTPFSDADLSTRAGMAEWVGTLLGGASLGMATRMIDGMMQLLSGNYLRGMELMMPKGVGDAIKAYRVGTEGMTRRNGDILMSPEDVSFWDSTLQALGITPVKQAVAYEKQQLVKKMDQNFQDRSTKIKGQYIRAMRESDASAANEARQAWAKLQEARVNNGYKKQPLSDLLKAPAEQKKREKNTINGVQGNKFNRSFIERQV